MYGYNGRDHHPQVRHEGRKFLVMKLYIEDPDRVLDALEPSAHLVLHPDPAVETMAYTVLECVDIETEEQVVFIGHEVEVVQDEEDHVGV